MMKWHHHVWLVCSALSLFVLARCQEPVPVPAVNATHQSYNTLKVLLQHLANKTAARRGQNADSSVRPGSFVKCSKFYIKTIGALSKKIGNALLSNPNRRNDQELMQLLANNFDCLFESDDADLGSSMVNRLLNPSPIDLFLQGLLASPRTRFKRSLVSETLLKHVDKSRLPKSHHFKQLPEQKLKLKRFYRVEFLFEDDFIFSYDLLFNTHKLFGSSVNKSSENSRRYNVLVNENTSVGSFICYVIVNNYEIVDNFSSKGRATYTSGLETALPGSLDRIYFKSDEPGSDVHSTFVLEPTNLGSSRHLADNQINVSLLSSPSFKRFINLYTLKLAKKLDRESTEMISLNFFMKNEPNSPLTTADTMVAKLNVFVNDTNDNAPKFEESVYKFKLSENNLPDQCFGSVKATDPDLEANGTVRYFLEKNFFAFKHVSSSHKTRRPLSSSKSNQNDHSYYADLFQNLNTASQTGVHRMNNAVSHTFYVDQVTGLVCTNATFDREEFDNYVLKVFAQDLGAVPLTNSEPCLIKLEIIDRNDNLPKFYLMDTFEHNRKTFNLTSQSGRLLKPDRFIYQDNQHLEFYLNEDSEPLTFIAMVKAYDVDKNENALIDYQLEVAGRPRVDDLFMIDSNGVIRSSKRIRYQIFVDRTDLKSTTESLTDEQVSFVDRRVFGIKIRARDRGKPQLDSFMEIKVVLIRAHQSVKLRAQIEGVDDPAVWTSYEKSALFWNKLTFLNHYEPLFKLNASRHLSGAAVKDLEWPDHDQMVESILARTRLNEPVFYSFQLVPRKVDFSLNFTSKLTRTANTSFYQLSSNTSTDTIDYGINCRQSDLVKFFSISRTGELFANSSMFGELDDDLKLCFLNVRVIDVIRANEFNENIEIAVIFSHLEQSKSIERLDELISFLRSKSEPLSDSDSFRYHGDEQTGQNVLLFDLAESNSSDFNQSLLENEWSSDQHLLQLKKQKIELSKRLVTLVKLVKRIRVR